MELYGIIPEGVGLVLSTAPEIPAWVRVLFLALPFARRAKDLPPEDRAAALAWIESTARDPRRVPGSEPVFVRLPLSWVAAWQGISKPAAKKHIDKLTRAGALVVVTPPAPNRATLYAIAPFASKPLCEVNPASKPLCEVNPLLSALAKNPVENSRTGKPFGDSGLTFSAFRVNPSESKNRAPEDITEEITESKGRGEGEEEPEPTPASEGSQGEMKRAAIGEPCPVCKAAAIVDYSEFKPDLKRELHGLMVCPRCRSTFFRSGELRSAGTIVREGEAS